MEKLSVVCYGAALLAAILAIVTSSEFELEVETPKSYSEWESKKDEVNKFTLTEGSSTRLKCRYDDEEINSTIITWTFVKCKFSECSGRGLPLCGSNCKPWLRLDKIKLNQGGLYSCYETTIPATPGYTLEARHLMSYHVTVLKAEIHSDPVFLESPSPVVKVMSMTKLSLSCRIMSLVPAIVRWFKQVPEPRTRSEPRNPTHIVYLNKTYQPLDWYPFERRGNEFSGKLIINRTKSSDAGNYVCCIVTSQFGIQLRESTVFVTPYIAPPRTREEEMMYEWSQAEKIWTAAVLAVVVLVTCGWTITCCCSKINMTSKEERPPRTTRQGGRRRRDPPPITTDTSDYEHV